MQVPSQCEKNLSPSIQISMYIFRVSKLKLKISFKKLIPSIFPNGVTYDVYIQIFIHLVKALLSLPSQISHKRPFNLVNLLFSRLFGAVVISMHCSRPNSQAIQANQAAPFHLKSQDRLVYNSVTLQTLSLAFQLGLISVVDIAPSIEEVSIVTAYKRLINRIVILCTDGFLSIRACTQHLSHTSSMDLMMRCQSL